MAALLATTVARSSATTDKTPYLAHYNHGYHNRYGRYGPLLPSHSYKIHCVRWKASHAISHAMPVL